MLPTHQTKIDEKTKVDEANHRLCSSIFVHVRQNAQQFSQVSMRIYLSQKGNHRCLPRPERSYLAGYSFGFSSITVHISNLNNHKDIAIPEPPRGY
jgi:hypothetical protein